MRDRCIVSVAGGGGKSINGMHKWVRIVSEENILLSIDDHWVEWAEKGGGMKWGGGRIEWLHVILPAVASILSKEGGGRGRGVPFNSLPR